MHIVIQKTWIIFWVFSFQPNFNWKCIHSFREKTREEKKEASVASLKYHHHHHDCGFTFERPKICTHTKHKKRTQWSSLSSKSYNDRRNGPHKLILFQTRLRDWWWLWRLWLHILLLVMLVWCWVWGKMEINIMALWCTYATHYESENAMQAGINIDMRHVMSWSWWWWYAMAYVLNVAKVSADFFLSFPFCLWYSSSNMYIHNSYTKHPTDYYYNFIHSCMVDFPWMMEMMMKMIWWTWWCKGTKRDGNRDLFLLPRCDISFSGMNGKLRYDELEWNIIITLVCGAL